MVVICMVFLIWENFRFDMIKIIFALLFMNFLILNNWSLIFYYNLCFFLSFLIIYIYIYKNLLWINIRISFGLDYYSIWLIMLSIWIIGLIIICLDKLSGIKIFIFINLMLILVVFFVSMDLILFYLIFEISLIPTFFLIIYWGSNPERLMAAYYLLMYTLFFSFPLLIYVFKIYFFGITLKFHLMILLINVFRVGLYGYLIVFIAFYIKIPIYLFHVWLPKAHVEAPVYGSMILAGVLLKMGGYGLVRFLEMLSYVRIKYNYLIFRVAIIGSIFTSLVRIVQIDIKRLVAYSSVVHINIILCSLITLNKLGFLSGYIIMISHGLCSSGLFYIVNLYYKCSGSRLIILNKGIISRLPILSMWWFIFCVINFSFPFSLSFVSEIFMLITLINWDLMLVVYLIMVCFFRRVYSLYLYSYIQHGDRINICLYKVSSVKEFLVLVIHLFPLIMILLNLLFYI